MGLILGARLHPGARFRFHINTEAVFGARVGGTPADAINRAPPRNYREALACDRDKALAFHTALQEEGIRTNQNSKFFLSMAHDDAIIDETLAAADRAMSAIA